MSEFSFNTPSNAVGPATLAPILLLASNIRPPSIFRNIYMPAVTYERVQARSVDASNPCGLICYDKKECGGQHTTARIPAHIIRTTSTAQVSNVKARTIT